MVEEDANSRLKQRARATVPPRNTSALKRQSIEENAIARPLPEKRPEAPGAAAAPEAKVQKLVSFTLRVEESVDKGLKALCADERITKETFLEAAYLACIENPEMMQQVVKMASSRREERRKRGVRRRAESMARYLTES